MPDSGMQHIDPKKQGVRDNHQLLIGCIEPRPIALVSTLSKDGIRNLAPFSFFNAFGANPPTVAFSPARSGRDGHFKDTYNNLVTTKECVVQVVTYDMVDQVNLASTEYAPNVDEFVKSGLTPVDSLMVRPPRVAESPFQMECRLKEMVSLGEGPAAGNLAICEVVYFHINDKVMVDGKIHPDRLDLVARLGGEYYLRASGDCLFTVPKPTFSNSLGFDQLPPFMKKSRVFTANNLGRFALVEKMPSLEEAKKFIEQIEPQKGDPKKFDTLQAAGHYKDMLALARMFAQQKRLGCGDYFERVAKIAIEREDFTVAWNAAVYAGFLHLQFQSPVEK